MKIKACTYHDENDIIDILATDGTKMYILCAAIENSLHTDMIGRSKLPSTTEYYRKVHFNGDRAYTAAFAAKILIYSG